MRIGNSTKNGFLYLFIAILLAVCAIFVIYVSDPFTAFAATDLISLKRTVVEEVDETKPIEYPEAVKLIETQEKAADPKREETVSAFLMSLFNIGYRQVSSNFPDYMDKASKYINESGIRMGGSFYSPSAFIEMIGDDIVKAGAEIECAYEASNEIQYGDKIYQNGILSIKIHSTGNLDHFKSFFMYDGLEVNKEEKIEVCTVLDKNADEKYTISEFMIGQYRANDSSS